MGLHAALQLRSAIFRNEKTNARIADPTPAHGARGQAARRRHRVRADAARITPNWDIYSGIAFMDGKIVNGDRANCRAIRRSASPTSRQRLDRLPPRRRLGDRRRPARPERHLAHRHQQPVADPALRRLDATVAYVQPKYERAAQRLQPHRQALLHRRLQEQSPTACCPGAAPGAADAHATGSTSLPAIDAAADSRGADARPGRAHPRAHRRGAAGSTATSRRATSRRRPSTTSSCPRIRRRRASCGEHRSRRSSGARCSSPPRCRSRSTRRSSTATTAGMTFGNHVDGAIRAHAATGRAHPHRSLGDAVPRRARGVRRRRAAGRGHLRRAQREAAGRRHGPLSGDQPAPRDAGHARRAHRVVLLDPEHGARRRAAHAAVRPGHGDRAADARAPGASVARVAHGLSTTTCCGCGPRPERAPDSAGDR